MSSEPAPAAAPQPDPLDYSTPYQKPPAESPRPTSITVLAIIGIVFGAGGLLCKPLSLAMFVGPMPAPNPVVDVFKNDSFLRLWMILNVGIGWIMSLLLLLSAVGSLRLKDWGRTGMLAYAGLAALLTIVTQVVGVVAVSPAVEQAVRQATGQAAGRTAPPGMLQLGPAASLAIGIALGLWFPVLIFWYFTRPRSKEAFRRGLPPAAARI